MSDYQEALAQKALETADSYRHRPSQGDHRDLREILLFAAFLALAVYILYTGGMAVWTTAVTWWLGR